MRRFISVAERDIIALPATRQYPLLLFPHWYARYGLMPHLIRFSTRVCGRFHAFQIHIRMRLRSHWSIASSADFISARPSRVSSRGVPVCAARIPFHCFGLSAVSTLLSASQGFWGASAAFSLHLSCKTSSRGTSFRVRCPPPSSRDSPSSEVSSR